MIFSSNIFCFLFLPVLLVIYYLVDKRFKNIILLCFSLLFYSWGESKYIYILFLIIGINYCLAICIDKNRLRARTFITLTVVLNLGVLFYFKYLTFLVENINNLTKIDIAIPAVSLPLGISFFTFQAMSYSIDVYRKKAEAQYNILDLALYIAFFPQLIAGPIVRYNSIEKQLCERTESLEKFSKGTQRFIVGLGKKAVLADTCAIIADKVFVTEAAGDMSVSVLMAWIGILAYTFQIYYDFSGYSDMAIGLGKMFGFEFEENFNYPYFSRSIQEYWRRWHISLGSWFREYVYYPVVTSKFNINISKFVKKLWGAKASRKISVILPLFVVWFSTGVWHGASWNYVGWGVYFAFLIIVESLGFDKVLKRWPLFLQFFYTWILIAIARAMIKTTSIGTFVTLLRCMTGLNGNSLVDTQSLIYLKQYFWMLLFCGVFSVPTIPWLKQKVIGKRIEAASTCVFYLIVLVVSLSFVIVSQDTPFIYFNF